MPQLTEEQVAWLSQKGVIRHIQGGRGSGKTYALLTDWRDFYKDHPQSFGLYFSPTGLYENHPAGLRVCRVSTLEEAHRYAGLSAARVYIDNAKDMEDGVVEYLTSLCRAPLPVEAVCYISST